MEIDVQPNVRESKAVGIRYFVLFVCFVVDFQSSPEARATTERVELLDNIPIVLTVPPQCV